MGKVSFVRTLKRSTLQLVISVFLGGGLLVACMGGGAGPATAPGSSNGAALTGTSQTDQSGYSSPLDAGVVAPTADHIQKIVFMSCSQGYCPVKPKPEIPGEKGEEWDGCYLIKFKMSVAISGYTFTDRVVRIVETSSQTFKDYYIHATGVVDVTLDIGPGKNYEFYNTDLPGAGVDNGSLIWSPCPGTYPDMACVEDTFHHLDKSMDESCSYLGKPTLDFKFPLPGAPKLNLPTQN